MFRRIISQCGARFFHSNSSSPQPWLVIGLGNPGDKFKGTRHNVGFDMIDAFAASQEIPMDSIHCKAVFGKGFVDGIPVFLAKPRTYMNICGESTGPLAAYYKLPLNRVLVIHDDMNLPVGVLRLVDKAGHGRHNGLRSVMLHFARNSGFPRLRIGVGRLPRRNDPTEFLLQKFDATAREQIDAGLQEGVDAIKQVVSKGLIETARDFNMTQKYKHISLEGIPAWF